MAAILNFIFRVKIITNFFFRLIRSKKSKRSRSRERRHRRSRSRSKSRTRSPSQDHRRYRREERHDREREQREREMEKERLREIAMEFKQSGAFSSITQQQSLIQEPTMPVLSSFPTFTSFPIGNAAISQPIIEIPQSQPKEFSQAYLEAVAASQRIAASRNLNDALSCSNSNDSASNDIFNSGSNSSKQAFLIFNFIDIW